MWYGCSRIRLASDTQSMEETPIKRVPECRETCYHRRMAADLTDYDVARELRKDPRTIQRWCKAGKLPGAYKAGRSWRIPQRTLRKAKLAGVLVADETERELISAAQACRELAEELDWIERRGRPRFPRDWPRLRNQLRVLQAELAGLAERASKAASRGLGPIEVPAGWRRPAVPPRRPHKGG